METWRIPLLILAILLMMPMTVNILTYMMLPVCRVCRSGKMHLQYRERGYSQRQCARCGAWVIRG